MPNTLAQAVADCPLFSGASSHLLRSGRAQTVILKEIKTKITTKEHTVHPFEKDYNHSTALKYKSQEENVKIYKKAVHCDTMHRLIIKIPADRRTKRYRRWG